MVQKTHKRSVLSPSCNPILHRLFVQFSDENVVSLLKNHDNLDDFDFELNGNWLEWVRSELESANEVVEKKLVPPSLFRAFCETKDGVEYFLQYSKNRKNMKGAYPNPKYYASHSFPIRETKAQSFESAYLEHIAVTPDLTGQDEQPYSLLVSDNALYYLSGVIAYFLRIIRVMASIQVRDQSSVLEYSRAIFTHCDIIRCAVQGKLDPDNVCGDLLEFARFYKYIAKDEIDIALTQKGKLFLRKSFDVLPAIVNFIGKGNVRVRLAISNNQLMKLEVDGQLQPISGRFQDALTLLRALWNAPNHKMAKSDFHKGDSNSWSKAKQQLKKKLSPEVFNCVYKDDAYGGDMELTDAIVIEM